MQYSADALGFSGSVTSILRDLIHERLGLMYEPHQFDQVADVAGIVSLVAEHDGSSIEPIEEGERGRYIVRLSRAQGKPQRQALPVDERVDLGREASPGTTETMISTPLFAVAACWCARIEVLSIIWMSPSWAAVIASINRSHTPAFRHLTKRL